jgi:hypothetical protein
VIRLTTKKDGSPRLCRLNSVTKGKVHPLPCTDDSLHVLVGGKFFSTLDLTSTYRQVGLDKDIRPKSVFLCRNGHFEFVRLPFGLSNAPATIPCLMHSVLTGLKWRPCLVYLDDIVVFSSSFAGPPPAAPTGTIAHLEGQLYVGL